MSKDSVFNRRMTLKDINLKEKLQDEKYKQLEYLINQKNANNLKQMYQLDQQIKGKSPVQTDQELISESQNQLKLQKLRQMFLKEQEQKVKEFQSQEFQKRLKNHYKIIQKGLKQCQIFQIRQNISKRRYSVFDQQQDQNKEEKQKFIKSITQQKRSSKFGNKKLTQSIDNFKLSQGKICELQCQDEKERITSLLKQIQALSKLKKAESANLQIMSQEMLEFIQELLDLDLQEMAQQKQIQQQKEEAQRKLQQKVEEKQKKQNNDMQNLQQHNQELQYQEQQQKKAVKKLQDLLAEQQMKELQQIDEQFSLEQSIENQKDNQETLDNQQCATQRDFIKVDNEDEFISQQSMQNISIVEEYEENINQEIQTINQIFKENTPLSKIKDIKTKIIKKQNQNIQDHAQLQVFQKKSLNLAKPIHRKALSQQQNSASLKNLRIQQVKQNQNKEEQANKQRKSTLTFSQTTSNTKSLKSINILSLKEKQIYTEILSKYDCEKIIILDNCLESEMQVTHEALTYYSQSITKQSIEKFLSNQYPTSLQINISIGIL